MGADEARAFEASPSHGARPGEVVDYARENFEQEIVSGSPALGYFCGDVFTLGSLHQVDLVERDALTFGEADGCAGGSAAGIVGDGFGRAGDFVLDVGLLGDEAADPGGEAARATEGFDGDALLIVFGGEGGVRGWPGVRWRRGGACLRGFLRRQFRRGVRRGCLVSERAWTWEWCV